MPLAFSARAAMEQLDFTTRLAELNDPEIQARKMRDFMDDVLSPQKYDGEANKVPKASPARLEPIKAASLEQTTPNEGLRK